MDTTKLIIVVIVIIGLISIFYLSSCKSTEKYQPIYIKYVYVKNDIADNVSNKPNLDISNEAQAVIGNTVSSHTSKIVAAPFV